MVSIFVTKEFLCFKYKAEKYMSFIQSYVLFLVRSEWCDHEQKLPNSLCTSRYAANKQEERNIFNEIY